MNDYFLNIAPEDPEGDAREQWESENAIIDLIGADTACELLYEAYSGKDIRPELERYMDEAWAKEIDRRIEDSHDYF